MQMAGPGATMRVNGFTGGRLPPKSQIRQIRFRMNSYRRRLPRRRRLRHRHRHQAGHGLAWTACRLRLPRRIAERAQRVRADASAPEQYRRFGLNADGPLVKGKTSIAFNLDGNNLRLPDDHRARRPTAQISAAGATPQDRMFGSRPRRSLALEAPDSCSVEVAAQLHQARATSASATSICQPRLHERDGATPPLRIALNGLIAPKVAHELKVQFRDHAYATLSANSPTPRSSCIDAFTRAAPGRTATASARRSRSTTTSTSAGEEARVARGPARRDRLVSTRLDLHELQRHVHLRRALDRYDLGPADHVLAAHRHGRSSTTRYWQLGLYVQDDWTPEQDASRSASACARSSSRTSATTPISRRASASRGGLSKYTVRGGYGIFNDWYERVGLRSRCCWSTASTSRTW